MSLHACPNLIEFHRNPCDELTFYDGCSKLEKKVIDRYNGNSDPQPITSLSNNMLIHFTSNDEIRYSGFELEYLQYHQQSKMDLFSLIFSLAIL